MVGVELTGFIDPNLAWKTVSKGNRSTARRSRRPVSFSTSQMSGAEETPPEQAAVHGCVFSDGESEHVPIKKRRFTLRSPSPPGYDDFSGIEMLAAAACGDHDDLHDDDGDDDDVELPESRGDGDDGDGNDGLHEHDKLVSDEAYDSQFEDGELREESLVHCWEDNEADDVDGDHSDSQSDDGDVLNEVSAVADVPTIKTPSSPKPVVDISTRGRVVKYHRTSRSPLRKRDRNASEETRGRKRFDVRQWDSGAREMRHRQRSVVVERSRSRRTGNYRPVGFDRGKVVPVRRAMSPARSFYSRSVRRDYGLVRRDFVFRKPGLDFEYDGMFDPGRRSSGSRFCHPRYLSEKPSFVVRNERSPPAGRVLRPRTRFGLDGSMARRWSERRPARLVRRTTRWDKYGECRSAGDTWSKPGNRLVRTVGRAGPQRIDFDM